MASQLGLTFPGTPNPGRVAVRFQSLRVWGAISAQNAGTPLQPLEVVIFDPLASTGDVSSPASGTGPRVLEQMIDFPDQVNRSVVGYTYPKAQRETAVVLGNFAGTPPVAAFAGTGPNSIVYLNIQWRPANTIPLTFLSDVTKDMSNFVIC
jgi:hypothetical protein